MPNNLPAPRSLGEVGPKTQFLSISKASQILGISPETLRRWDKQGILSPARTDGGQRRYSLANIEVFLEQKEKISKTASSPPSPPSLSLPASLNSHNARRYTLEEIKEMSEIFKEMGLFNPSPAVSPAAHSHPAFSAVILSFLLLLFLVGGAVSAYFLTPASFKSSLLSPLASFLLSGGARVEGTMRFLAYLYFGETDDYFISPLGDASFRNLKAGSITASSITTTSLTAQTVEGAVSWKNVTEKPVILSSLDNVTNNEGNIDLIASCNITITPNDSQNTVTFTVPATPQGSGSGLDADLLDSLDRSEERRVGKECRSRWS